MKFPKAKKMTKHTIDLVHLAAASVWLGGLIVLFALNLDGGASLGLTSADTQLTIEAFRRKFIGPCIPLLMATAVLYGISTPWGFAKHGWIVAKWVLAVTVVVGFAVLSCSTASVGAALACVIALFTISVYKPDKKKAKAKPEKAKVGKDKQRVSELNSRQKEGRPPERKARHMEHSMTVGISCGSWRKTQPAPPIAPCRKSRMGNASHQTLVIVSVADANRQPILAASARFRLFFRRIPLARVRCRKGANACDNNLNSIMKRLVGIGTFNRLRPFGHIDRSPDFIIVKRIDHIHFINHEPTQECIDDAPETFEDFLRNALVVMQLLHAFRMSPQSGRKCSAFDFEQTCSRMPNFHRAN